jgi:hypothetical protein
MRLHFMDASRGWPGSHSLFLASPRKSEQKEGDRRLALRVMAHSAITFYALQKMGNERNSLRSNNVHF